MIAIVQGGGANIASVQFALERLGKKAELTSDPDLIGAASHVILPGVGAAAAAMSALQAAELTDCLQKLRQPFLGICLGLQAAVTEYARNVCGVENAGSSEFGDRFIPVIDLMEEQKKVNEMGGTMRLGAYPTDLSEGSFAAHAYGKTSISERHRHRYEVNQEFLPQLEAAGMKISGLSPDKKFVEIVEYADHPWFVACQFHPEYKSRPLAPHPLFREFVAACYRRHREGREALRLNAADAYDADRDR